jgi:tetratricopeptide (TPR) repeat protein
MFRSRALPGSPVRPRLPHPHVTGWARIGRALLCGWLACVVLTGCAAGRHRAHAEKEQAAQLAERARLAEERGDTAEAEKLMTAAVRTNPLDCEARLELSEMQLEHGSLDQAAAHLRRLIASNPEDPRMYIRLAQTEFLRGNPREAEIWLDRGLELDPDGEQALMLKGRLAELRDRGDEASVTYFRVLDGNPDNIDARLRLARLMIERNDPNRAAPLLRDALQHESSRPEHVARARWMLGETYVLTGRYKDAATEMGRALEFLSPRAEDWYELALVREQAGDIQGAVAAVDRSLELDPALVKAREFRGLFADTAAPSPDPLRLDPLRLAADEQSRRP